jgi:UDP-N-acetylmuramoyl-L-alanyl-D-glutamate--2,6-diaminopimelate ligase
LITVFGCPGEADRGKRPVMGEMAARLSDITIITTDNPRGEDPVEIIKEIETGMKGARKYAHDENPRDKGYFAIPDRGEAILKAVEISMPGDAILVAGKGHEDCQIIGAERVPFKDRTVLECALRTVAPFLK